MMKSATSEKMLSAFLRVVVVAMIGVAREGDVGVESIQRSKLCFMWNFMKMNLHYVSKPLCTQEDWHELEQKEEKKQWKIH